MRRSGIAVMTRLVELVRPLAGHMALAIAMGLVGHPCATALTVLGAYGILSVMGEASLPLAGIAGAMALCAVARGALRYGEQACNHFIAFKLLALIRDRVFRTLRRLAPAKLEGRGKGELSGFVLDSLRGLGEIQQYDRGAERLDELRERTRALTVDEERLKRVAGRNAAASGAVVLVFDIGMLLLSAWVCGSQEPAGVLVPTVTLMGSFGPTIALASLGGTLQGTFAAGNRVLDILNESPGSQMSLAMSP